MYPNSFITPISYLLIIWVTLLQLIRNEAGDLVERVELIDQVCDFTIRFSIIFLPPILSY
jgi:hypothetical protein